MADSFRQRLARWLLGRSAPARSGQRLYSSAANTRWTTSFGSSANTSADQALAADLVQLRARSRQMVRDSAYARRAKLVVQNNVVGGGVGLQAQVANIDGRPSAQLNDRVESAWRDWCRADACHTGGALHFSDMERLLIGEVFEAGEVLLRKHYAPFGSSRIPFALEVIEPERLLDQWSNTAYPLAAPGNQVRMGIEVDPVYQRPVAYYLRDHPGDTRWGQNPQVRVQRVPASQIMHLKLADRWPQTRGTPWMHAVLDKLNDMAEYSRAELQAARASSYYFGTIESDDAGHPLATSTAEDGTTPPQIEIQSGLVQQLAPGEKLNFHSPDRPNAALDPFIRHMLREVAAGVGVSYEDLSKDYSQSNYSSSRLSLLSDRDLWRVLQQWWVRSFREPLHREWLSAAVMARAIPGIPVEAYAVDPARYEAALFKCRGWSWVDPTKEVAAYKEAVKAGFTTITDVVASTAGGMDIEDVIAVRKRELAMLEEAGIDVDTTVEEAVEPAPVAAPDEGDDEDAGQDDAQRLRVINTR